MYGRMRRFIERFGFLAHLLQDAPEVATTERRSPINVPERFGIGRLPDVQRTTDACASSGVASPLRISIKRISISMK